MKDVKEQGKEKIGKSNQKQIWVTLISIIIVIIIVIVGIVFIKNRKNNVSIDNTPKIEEVVKNKTNTKQEDIEIKGITIESLGSNMLVKGKLENKGKDVKSLSLNFNLYNEKEQIKGENTKHIKSIKQGETKEFEISIVGDYLDLKTYEIKLEKVKR